MKKDTTYLISFMISLLFMASCSEDMDDSNVIELGIYISLDKSDTLDFSTPRDFYKSNGVMYKDHYDYQLFPNDSIEIGYSGKLFINVQPTMYKYSIKKNELIIDFENKPCYGFDKKIITYRKD